MGAIFYSIFAYQWEIADIQVLQSLYIWECLKPRWKLSGQLILDPSPLPSGAAISIFL